MPASAISHGVVDLLLPVSEMPSKLEAFASTPIEDRRQQSRAEKRRSELEEEEEDEGVLERILSLVADHAGRDFSAYKRGTLLRRIDRRRSLLQIEDLEAYANHLENEPSEIETLWRDWLIGVTGFFRDAPAFEVLREALVPRIEQIQDGEELRFWVPGCASGEEAYSLAILAFELLEETGRRLNLRIFATDVDERAIETARAGCYPEGTIADVGPERTQRFFDRQDSQYRVGKKVRDAVVFAPQNLLQDPPFTKMDLISCRNLLIYLKPKAQKRILMLLHYSLKPEGLLFLGSSESITGVEELFDVVHARCKIFRRSESGDQAHVPTEWVGSAAALANGGRPKEHRERGSLDYSEMLRSQLLGRYAPPAVIADQNGRIEQIHGRTGAFLEPAPGGPDSNVLQMAREGLRNPLTAALRELARSEAASSERDIRVQSNGDTTRAHLVVRRLTDPRLSRPLFLISFEPPRVGPAATNGREHPSSDETPQDPERVGELEEELRRTREDLQGAIEDLQSTNEELASANEEVQSVNEELQSTNEELMTSKEETQSLNEELQTVNSELNAKVANLEETQDDLMNLVNVTRVAIIFLDEHLRVKRFTPEAQRLFPLVDDDIGRPLVDIRTRLEYPHLEEDAQEVSRTLVPEFREVRNEDGTWWTAEIRPYRTSRNAIEGLVFTFVNVTRMKETATRAEEESRTLEAIVDTVREPLVILDGELRVVRANASFYDTFQVSRSGTEGVLLYDLGAGQWRIPELQRLLERVLPANESFEEYHVQHDFPHIGLRHMVLNARRLERNGEPHRILLAIEDQTDRAPSGVGGSGDSRA